MKRKLIFIFTTIVVILTLAVTILSTVSFSSQEISFTLIPDPYIDIVLAKSKTSTNLNNFKQDMLNSLSSQGINTSKVEISAIETFNITVTDNFNWQKYTHVGADGSNGLFHGITGDHITINNANKSILFQGYEVKGYKDFLLYADQTDKTKTIQFTVNTSTAYWHTLDAAGFLVNSEIKNGILAGYAVMIRNGYISVYKFNNGVNASSFSNSSSGSMTNYASILTNYPISNGLGVHNFKLVIEKDSIVVYDNNSQVISLAIPPVSNTAHGFGPIASYNSHNCNELSQITFTNVNMSVENVQSFTEVLRQPDWREGAIKVLVSVEDYQNEELSNSSTLGELLTRLLNENIYFASWGNSSNQAQFQALINSNNGNGTFINNNNYSNSINQTAIYIKSILDNIEQKDDYVILNDLLNIQINPPEYATNTADSNYPYGKWRIVHDFNYYENHVGQFANTGKYMEDFIKEFDKTGKFTITYADNSIAPSEVYVHRRPTALLKSTKTGNSISLISNSYDLDKYSTGNQGIAQEEWKYKKTTDDVWVNGKLTTLTNDTDYVVQLRVQDYQGVWSYPTSIYATSRLEAKPIANFGIKNSEMSRYEQLEVIDTSYDPYGGTITSRTWEVYQGDKKIYTGNNPPTSYDTVGDYSMSLTVTNNRGLTSETYTRKFTIIEDNIPPEVVAEPLESDWTEQVDVRIEFNDYGGSKFKSYQYAITDSQALPTSWSNAITNQTDRITISTEGIQYLHIKAVDNAGNVSDDRVLGPYRIDRTNPNITYTGDLENIKMNTLELNLQATDTWSGVQSFTLNEETIQNGIHTFTQNGTYSLVATDRVGHKSVLNITISNIYYECKAGLEHPIYSSSFEKCPICASYEGLTIQEESHIYNSEGQGVKYDNPKKAPIVEYYNNNIQKPEIVGTYAYELKVIYQQVEYKTPFKGNYQITPKEITITDIVAQNKIYNANTQVVLNGGRLQDVCKGDEVRFELPYLGNTESKNIGNWNVAIDTITLEGEHAQNYTLKQPEYGTVTAEITKRFLTVTNLQGKNRIYNGNNIVDITGGEIVGMIEKDNVIFHIPEQGKAESPNVGTWTVKIEDITIEGEDALNYRLVQPNKEDIKVVISKEKGKLVIGCENKKYDREPVEPYVIENNSTSEVEYHFYKANTQEEIKEPFDLGIYDVIAYMPTDGNFTEATSNKITFEITKPDAPLLKITSKVVEINEKTVNNVLKRNAEVHYQDTIKIEFSIENMGEGSGYAQKITNWIPEGLSFLPENEINVQNGWQETEKGIVETTKLSLESDINNELFSTLMQKTNYLENEKIKKEEQRNNEKIALVLKVENSKKQSFTFLNKTQLIQQDKRGDLVEYLAENEEYGKTQIGMDFKYVDLQAEVRITDIIEKNAQEQKQFKYDIYQKPGEMVKLELAPKKIDNTYLTICYQINITNLGNEIGILENIIDVLPEGTNFQIAQNEGWILNREGNAQYDAQKLEILPRETKRIEITLNWEATEENLAQKTNKIAIQASNDLDEILLQEEKIQLEKTNNYASSSMLVSVITGRTIVLWTILTICVLGILVTGILIIKKYVIK